MKTKNVGAPFVVHVVSLLILCNVANAEDCNNNGAEDALDIAYGISQDCQPNGVPDECDIAGGAPDDDADGVPDICDSAPGVGDDLCWNSYGYGGTPCSTDAECTLPARCGLKSRYITIKPNNQFSGEPTSIRVEIVALRECAGEVNAEWGCFVDFQCPGNTCVDSPKIGHIWWAGPEQSLPDTPHPPLRGARVQCTDAPHSQVWTSGDLHLFGYPIVPGSTYGVRMCDPDGENCTGPRVVATGKWGDVARSFGGGANPNLEDVSSIAAKFFNSAWAPSMPRCDLVGAGNSAHPNRVNHVVNFHDISAGISAFSVFPFPFTVPACVP